MNIFGKSKNGEKKASSSTSSKLLDRRQERNLVARYARGNVTLQLGRYTTAEDTKRRKLKIAEMDL